MKQIAVIGKTKLKGIKHCHKNLHMFMVTTQLTLN